MSLINDALKRARETQPKGDASAAGPSLRPVDAPRGTRRSDLLLPLLVAVILLLAAILFGLWWQSGMGVVTVRAKSLPETVQPVSPAVAAQPVAAIAIAPKNSVTSNATNGATATATAPATNAILTNIVAVVEPPKPAPITYKLQTIFYRPGSPSAVINGKMVYSGGKIGDAHVLTIGKESATIVTASGQTILLELP